MRFAAGVAVLGACTFSTGIPTPGVTDAPPDDDAQPPGSEPAAFTCPPNYVLVPDHPDFTAGEFCIAKYEAKVVGGVALSQASGTPTGTITVTAAKAACAANGARYHLVTNEEWMATARAIEAVPDNWSTTATPFLSKGNTDACGGCPQTVTCPGPAGPDVDPCIGTKVATCTDRSSVNFRFNRTAKIGAGVIWDLSGNMFELIDFPMTMNANEGVHPGEPINNTTGTEFSPDWPEAKYKSANRNHTDDGGMTGQLAVNNVGLLYVTSPTMSPHVTRGGDYCGFAGIYAIGLLRTTELGVNVGFRCAYK